LKARRIFDTTLLLLGLGAIALFTTRYLMPFRLDDVLLMLWAKTHSLADVFNPVSGQMINSFRPAFSLAALALTRFAGWDHPFWWHLTLDLSLITGIAFTGLTARYIVQRWYALELSVGLYFLAFLPILNIFFWYSDLTYGLELVFSASAWYFGLRGLYEARIRFWLMAMLLASVAVLSKEPAFVLIHVVFLGSFLIERHTIIARWKLLPNSQKNIAIAAYLIVAAITIWLALISPTRGNRFIPMSSPDLAQFVQDRINYYSAIYLSSTARILLFLPIVYAFLRTISVRRFKQFGFLQFLLATLIAAIISIAFFRNILIALPLTAFIFVTISTFDGTGRAVIRRLLPFLACLIIAVAALLFTIQLVKTQLTEAALLTAILSSWAWCVWIEDLRKCTSAYKNKRAVKWIFMSFGIVETIVFLRVGLPKIESEELMLREIRDVRSNANEAVSWAAKNLPANASFAVGVYSLHGIAGNGELTSKSDQTKLSEQYTFAGGFVYDALAVLGRNDLRRTYLADSNILPRVLDAMRGEPNSYIFLQSKPDLDLFHGVGRDQPLLIQSDSLTAKFTRGPYPCEIWMLRW
jgi:hypothetical protein